MTKSFCTALLLVALVLLVLGAALPAIQVYLFVTAAIGAIIALFLVLQNFGKRLWQIQEQISEQAGCASRRGAISAAVEVHAAMTIVNRFPGLAIPTSSYSMRFANLMTVVDLLDKTNPRVVVELGSGISTLCVAAWMKEHGRGKIWSFDHDSQWCEITRRHLNRSGIDTFAEVILAPLCERQYKGHRLRWYDLERHLDSVGPIDMLIIDGPPTSLDRAGMSRFPALDVFARRLSADGSVVFDDAARPEERALIEAWKEAFPKYRETFIPTLTGISVLQQERPSELDASPPV